MHVKTPLVTLLVCALSAPLVLAHGGVQNPAVLERMQGMSRIADEMKILGGMAKGAEAFEASVARSALGRIADQAARIAPLFETEETDPKTEARPEIWLDYADFTARAQTLEDTARDLSTDLDSAEDLSAAMQALGRDCKSCHALYRTQN